MPPNRHVQLPPRVNFLGTAIVILLCLPLALCSRRPDPPAKTTPVPSVQPIHKGDHQ